MNLLSYPTITLLSSIIWLFPPIKHFKRFFFLYFLILAISDILMTTFLIIKINIAFNLYLIISFLLLLSIQKIDFIKSKKILILILGIIIILISVFYPRNIFTDILFTLIHFLIIIKLLYFFVIYIADNKALNIFYLVLVFYELTVLTKFLEVFSFNFNVTTNFILTTGFEIACGLFFCIFRDDSRKIIFQLR